MPRQFPRKLKTIVIKVGSSLLATYKLKPRTAQLRALVQQICNIRSQNMDVILVSSGAIVLGLGELGKRTRPGDLKTLQASAAVGQTLLMNIYAQQFKRHSQKCAQVLLTWEDFQNRKRFNNAKHTLLSLLQHGIVPIINENDTVSTDEIRHGDNDKLAALVASLIGADVLVLLSDVEGLYDDRDGDRKFFNEISEITDEIKQLAGGTAKKNFAKGGMQSKIDAVHIASHAKIPCIIANGRTENVIERIVNKERIGTFFVEKDVKMLDRKHWISFGSKPKGKLTVDEGAHQALMNRGRSLLLPGVLKYEGDFKRGDVLIVEDQNHIEFARGLSQYTSAELSNMQDLKNKKEIIHVDDLVLSVR